MQLLHSPQFSTSAKHDLFKKQRSPSFRNKRIPSIQDQYLCSSNLKLSKQDSPSKLSQEIKRRKSHFIDSNQLSNSGNKKKSKGGNRNNNDTQQIMDSIQSLKEEYKTLRQAYKQLIQQKIRHKEEMTLLKNENNNLTTELLVHKKNEQLYKYEIMQLRQTLLEEQSKTKRLQNDIYFMTQRQKSKTENLHHKEHFVNINQMFQQQQDVVTENLQIIEEINGRSNSNASLLSFSLTEIIDQSAKLDHIHRVRKEHTKVVSDLSHAGPLKNQSQPDHKHKKQTNFKKKKGTETINESKVALASNPLNQLLNLKSPSNLDKKNIKNFVASSTTRRRKLEDKENTEARNPKKKSKKLQLSGNE